MENFAHKLETIIAETKIRHVVVARLGDFVPMLKRWAFNFANSYIQHAVPAWHFETFTMLQDACSREPSEKLRGRGAAGDCGGAVAIYRRHDRRAERRDADASQSDRQHAAMSGLDRKHRLEHENERVLTPLPLYHIFSLTANLLSFAVIGGLNVLDSRSAQSRPAYPHHRRRTHHGDVRRQYAVQRAGPQARFCRAWISARCGVAIGGGAAVQSEVAHRWREITGTDLVEGYGLTEASPVVCINPISSPKLGTVGLPVPSTEVTIRDDHGAILAPGEQGEVWVRGPQVMQGYWRRPDETKAVLTADGWLRTGDIGMFDAQGYLKLLDRKKDMVIVSGFKVFPNEVEDIAMQHPGVLEAAVIGVPDERTGQAVKLFVVKRDPALTTADLIAFLRARLVNYKVPHIVEFRDFLPKSNIGKILRKELH